MSSDFTPQFPRTVAGTEWRAPLDHPEIEAIAKRLDHMYRNFGLSEAHRAEILARYAHLAKADEAIDSLLTSTQKLSGRDTTDVLPLGDPGIRPKKPRHGNSVGEGLHLAVGFVRRLAEWVQRLEDTYGVTAWKRFGEIVNHDEDDNPDPSPGDDI